MLGSPQGYTLGDINGQPNDGNNWMKTGSYDVAVVTIPNTASAGFDGTQALRLSDSVTSASFGDQTFSPGVDPAGQSTPLRHFESRARQPGAGTLAASRGPVKRLSLATAVPR